MKEDIIKRIRAHIASHGIAIPFPPASESAIRDAEQELGVRLPPILRSIYSEIGNGGFGPGYGVIGVQGGHASGWGTLLETLKEIKRGAEYLKLDWNPAMLPFLEWGCASFSCVACDDPQFHVFRTEERGIYAENYTLGDFFDMWMNGADLFDLNARARVTAEVRNPFTGKRVKVTGSKRKPS